MFGGHQRTGDEDGGQIGMVRLQPEDGGLRGLEHRIAIAATADRRDDERSARRQPILLTDRMRIGALRFADDVAAIMQLTTDRRWNRVGFRHVKEVPRAVNRDAVIQVLEGTVHSKFLPLPSNPTDTVHDVAHAEDELRRRALLLQSEEAVAKLPFPTEWFMIDQHEVRGQPEGCDA